MLFVGVADERVAINDYAVVLVVRCVIYFLNFLLILGCDWFFGRIRVFSSFFRRDDHWGRHIVRSALVRITIWARRLLLLGQGGGAIHDVLQLRFYWLRRGSCRYLIKAWRLDLFVIIPLMESFI